MPMLTFPAGWIPPRLGGPAVVQVARELADAVTGGAVDTREIALACELPIGRIQFHQAPQPLWLELVRMAEQGVSAALGCGAPAVLGLIDAVAEALPGNQALAFLAAAYDMGGPRAAPTAAGAVGRPGMPPRAGGAGPAGGGSGVFLSYSHKDVRDVECLYQALVNQAPGIPVFMDRHSLAAGQKWLEAIQLHAGRASVLVCWGTDAFLRSSFTHYEVGLAEALGARIVPIVVDEKAWNQAPAYLSQRHSVLPAHPLRFDEVADRLSELLRDPALPGLPAPAAAGSGSAASGGS